MMKIYQLTHIGEFHTDHNEDFLIVEELNSKQLLLAVMDGCSSGTDSHFASALIGKLLRKLAKQEAFRVFAQKNIAPISSVIETISLQLFEELRDVNRLLDLKSDEVLSTLILAIVDKNEKSAEAVVVGDGVIHFNGQTIEFENDNKPDYIGYHLNMDKHLWFQTRTERRSFKNIHDFSISTDGIYTFKNFDGKSYPALSEEAILHDFFVDQDHKNNPNKLKKSLLKIKNVHGLQSSDDLTIIRLIFG
ncbi:MAG: protein phosphatase 2C domain-containing protein [Saprospiraceae bacterium]|nr:protein phosphatase 2C domain-containing protein [Saprospiraceae bacterium]